MADHPRCPIRAGRALLVGLWTVCAACGGGPVPPRTHHDTPPPAAPAPPLALVSEPAPATATETVTHALAEGETLWQIARHYGLSMAQVMEQNGLSDADARKLRPGRMLSLTGVTNPAPLADKDKPTLTSTEPSATASDGAFHYLREGESLWTVARLYDVPLDALRTRNGFSEDRVGQLQIGQAIVVPGLAADNSQSPERIKAVRDSEAAEQRADAHEVPAPPKPESRARRAFRHLIARGETVWDIARNFGVSVAEIMAANGLDEGGVQNIREGQELTLPGVEDDGRGHTRKPRSGADQRSATTAVRLGLGDLIAAGKLLHGRVEARWATAAGSSSTLGTLRWPVAQGWFVRGFGSGQGGYHKAMDIMGKIGWNVRAAAPGIVGYSGDKVPGFGNMVMVVHPGGWVTLYAHNSVNFVRAGERVQQGAILAEVGSTGRSTGPHVHFELIYQGQNCDPAPLFRPGVRHRSGKYSRLEYTSWQKPSKRPKSVQCAVRQKHPAPVINEDPTRDAQPVDDRDLRDTAPDDAFANLVRELAAPSREEAN